MQEVYDLYRKSGFIIIEIRFDNEFHKSMDSFAEKQTPAINFLDTRANSNHPSFCWLSCLLVFKRVAIVKKWA